MIIKILVKLVDTYVSGNGLDWVFNIENLLTTNF